MTLNEVAQRYGHRPGYRLADAIPVALPVYVVNFNAIVIGRKKIPLTDEFILRAVETGITGVADLGGFLGLEEQFVLKRLARLASDELLTYRPEPNLPPTISLTPKGVKALANESHTIRPRQESLSFLLDGITRLPITSYAGLTRILIPPKQARQWGLMEIRAFPNTPPDHDELRVLNLTDALPKRVKKERGIHQIMELVKLGQRPRRLREAVMLVYHSDSKDDDVAVSFFIDGRPALDIDRAFANAGGLRKLRIAEQLAKAKKENQDQLKESGVWKLAEEAVATEKTLHEEIDPTLQRIEEVGAEARLAAERLAMTPADANNADLIRRLDQLEAEKARLEKVVTSVAVRYLRMQEHRPLFEKCLDIAKKHLLIISPWISDAVVTDARLQKFEAVLQRGAKLTIGYGISEDRRDERGSNAIRDLEALKKRFPNSFTFHRLGDTHEKILLMDSEVAVVGSFNWLSFEGRSSGKLRREASVLISDPTRVIELFSEFLGRFPQ